MAVSLPEDETYVVTNKIMFDAPSDFVWENLPKNADISHIMTPYRGFPGAKSWETIDTFNEPGPSIVYKMSNGLTIRELIMKRADYHYVYAYPMPFRNFIFDFWQGNLFYRAVGNQTEVTWKYWLKPQDNPVGKLFARMIIKLVWRGYTKKGADNMKNEIMRLYNLDK